VGVSALLTVDVGSRWDPARMSNGRDVLAPGDSLTIPSTVTVENDGAEPITVEYGTPVPALPPSSEVLAAAAAVFLLDRLAEREQLARSALLGYDITMHASAGTQPSADDERWASRWRADYQHVTSLVRRDGVLVEERVAELTGANYPAAAHIVSQDPAAVLADVAAQRAAVEELQRVLTDYCDDGEPVLAAAVLLMLVQAHAGHPDYRQEWKP
jgi:hypothetical protein